VFCRSFVVVVSRKLTIEKQVNHKNPKMNQMDRMGRRFRLHKWH